MVTLHKNVLASIYCHTDLQIKSINHFVQRTILALIPITLKYHPEALQNERIPIEQSKLKFFFWQTGQKA